MTAPHRTRLAALLGTVALGGLLGGCATYGNSAYYGNSSYYAADPVYCGDYSNPDYAWPDDFDYTGDSDGNRYYYDEYGNYYYYDDAGNCYYYDARDEYYRYYMPSYGYYSSSYYPNYFFGNYYGYYPYWPSYSFHGFYHYYYPAHFGFWWHHHHPHHGGGGDNGGDNGNGNGGTPGNGGTATPPAGTPPGVIGSRPERGGAFPRLRPRSERDAFPVQAGVVDDGGQAGGSSLKTQSDSEVKTRDDPFLALPGTPGRFGDMRRRDGESRTVPFGLPLNRSSSPPPDQSAAPAGRFSSPPRATAPSVSTPRASPSSAPSKPPSASPRPSRPSVERPRPSRGRGRD